MILLRLTWLSLLNRKSTVLLALCSMSISLFLLLAVDSVRTQTKASFSNTVSGTDLIVGARSGQVNLLLYSVFRIGNATNNISWGSYQALSQHRNVDWSIPFSLGDSHRGYRVLGTTSSYFRHFRYGQKQLLEIAEGKPFKGLFDVVLGAEVAKALNYKLGDKIVISHGMGNAAIETHDEMPFEVVGILAPTGTPVDGTLHVSLEAIEAIHIDWRAGVKMPGRSTSAEEALTKQLQPQQITAFMLGLKSRMAVFQMQRSINQYRREPLMAIIPGLALQELWQMFSLAEKALMAVSALVVMSSLVGLLTLMLTSLKERRREMAILRSVGARPWHIMLLLLMESVLVTLVSLMIAVALLFIVGMLGSDYIYDLTGLRLHFDSLSLWQWQLLSGMLVCGSLVGVIPGIRAYRNSLTDGMTVRL